MQILTATVLILGVIAFIAGWIVVARMINSDEAAGKLISPIANQDSVRQDVLVESHSN